MILFVVGLVALVSAAAMLVLREPMRVALALITSMTALGAIYGLIGVHFIAAFQVLIYVGAVMVFMVYVIMLLEVREHVAARRFSRWLLPAGVAGTLLLGAAGVAAARSGISASAAAPRNFGLQAFSTEFLSSYWLEFELTTVLLVSAVAAALAVIAVSRRRQG